MADESVGVPILLRMPRAEKEIRLDYIIDFGEGRSMYLARKQAYLR